MSANIIIFPGPQAAFHSEPATKTQPDKITARGIVNNQHGRDRAALTPLLIRLLRAFGAAIDALNAHIGRAAVWLLLAAVLLSAGNAIMRRAFATSSNAFLEAQWYLIGTLVMVGAPWVLQRNAHVRIELLSTPPGRGS